MSKKGCYKKRPAPVPGGEDARFFQALVAGPIARLTLKGKVVCLKRNNMPILRGLMGGRFATLHGVIAGIMGGHQKDAELRTTKSMNIMSKICQPTIIKTSNWRRYLKLQVASIIAQLGAKGPPRYAGPCQVTCEYYPPDYAHLPDLNGMTDSVLDILEDAEVIVNDNQVASTDGSRIRPPDKENPRIEVIVLPYMPGEFDLRKGR